MKPFRVGIDSYSLKPLELSPFETLDWAQRQGGAGVQFTEVHLRDGQQLDDALLKDVAAYAAERGLYIEWGGGQHIPFDTTTWQTRDIFPINQRAARQAHTLGTSVVRSCSGGLMRWSDEAPPTEALLRAMARTLRPQKPMLTDLGVVLALELHFEFTTFELLRLFDMCDAEPDGCFGICLDPMNLLTMLESPVAATERILPWIVATHAKDGALRLTESGFESFTVEAGCGSVNFPAILRRLATLNRPINLSVEDHGGSFDIPIFDPTFLSRFPDLTAAELSALLKLARAAQGRLAAGEIAPLARAEWPRHCERRVRNGIVNIKRIVAEMVPPTSAE
ncbi:MAG: sugar phosphate isomerase/epimerase [Planctomycetes bacterium]|nr:sugar phosphate isomerase/epimerase [Planctomycetota bacterium]